MQSGILWFNKRTLRKDLTRFWPAWALYLVLLCTVVFSGGTSLFEVYLYGQDRKALPAAYRILHSLPGETLALNAFHGFLVGQLVFRYLYQQRQTVALHAMPLRREGWYFTHTLAAALMGLAPQLLVALLGLLGDLRAPAAWLTWLAGSMVQYLLFFSMSAAAAQVAGTQLGAVLAFLLPCGGLWLTDTILMDFISGHLTAMLSGTTFLQTLQGLVWPGLYDAVWENGVPIGTFSWGQWGIALGIAAGFWLWGLWLYRTRKLESAGSFMARPKLGMIVHFWLCFLFTFAFRGLINLLTLGVSDLIILPLALLMGCFGSEMLMRRSVRVFGRRQWARFGACALALSLVIGSAYLPGINARIWGPTIGGTDSVSVWTAGDYGHTRLEREEQIRGGVELYRDLIAGGYGSGGRLAPADGDDEAFARLIFDFQGTWYSSRWVCYLPLDRGEWVEQANALVNSPAACLRRLTDGRSVEEFRRMLQTAVLLTADGRQDLDPQALLEAMAADAAEGHMGLLDSEISWRYPGAPTKLGTLRLYGRTEPSAAEGRYGESLDWEWTLPGCASHTLAYLAEQGILF